MTDTRPLRHLSRLNAQFIENYVRNDVAAHDALLHPDFSYINGDGARIGRAAYLAAWATGFDRETILYWDLRDEVITCYGAVAFASAVNRYVEMAAGCEVEAMAAYTDTYIFDGGVWRCLRAQITPVGRSHWPSDDGILRVYIRGVLQPGSRYGVP